MNTSLNTFIIKHQDFYKLLSDKDKEILKNFTEFGDLTVYFTYEYNALYEGWATTNERYLYIGKRVFKNKYTQYVINYYYRCYFDPIKDIFYMKNGTIIGINEELHNNKMRFKYES